uniref:Uncharacterized protein n=1 Tax=Rhizophora mucronata TaxID=61149 RepID=A0A2P2IJ02_RHIMU
MMFSQVPMTRTSSQGG